MARHHNKWNLKNADNFPRNRRDHGQKSFCASRLAIVARVNTSLIRCVYGVNVIDGDHTTNGTTTMDLIKNIRCVMVWRNAREMERMNMVCNVIDGVTIACATFVFAPIIAMVM